MTNPKTLLVDDERGLTDLGQLLLEREGLDVDTAYDATEAEAMLEENSYDAVISDYDMPDRTGVELLKRVRAQYDDLAFVLYTGKGTEEVASEAIANDVDGYHKKQSGNDIYRVLAEEVKSRVRERKIDQEKQMLEVLLENIQDTAYLMDEDQRITYINQAGAEHLETDKEDIKGRETQDFVELGVIPEENLEFILDAYQEAEENGEGRFIEELELPGGNMHVYGTVTSIPGGGYAGIIKDVSDLKEAEERADLIATSVTHDMKNVLNRVQGYAQMIDEEQLDETTQEYYSRMLDAVEDAENLIQKTSTIQRIAKEDSISQLNLDAMLANVKEDLSTEAEEEGIDIKYESSDSAIAKVGPLMKTLYYNIIDNSIEHSGGDTIELELEESEEMLETRIKDNGSGLSEEEREKLLSGNGSLGSKIITEIGDLYDLDIDIRTDSKGTEYIVRARKAEKE